MAISISNQSKTGNDMVKIQILRKSDAINMFGYSKSTFQNRINEGLMPPGISLGARAVGFLEHELKSVLIAMINNKREHEIRIIVNQLLEKRTELEVLL